MDLSCNFCVFNIPNVYSCWLINKIDNINLFFYFSISKKNHENKIKVRVVDLLLKK